MATRAIPVIICGRRAEIAKSVAAAIGDDYELVHFIPTPEAGIAELPLVLQGIMPNKIENNLGSGNISGLAKAVILGGGYDENSYAAMKKAVDQASLAHPPVWLRVDASQTPPPMNEDYGRMMAKRLVELLKKLNQEKKLDGSDGGSYVY